MHLAAVIPATDGPASLDRCLLAIGDAHEPPDEVVVVDDPVVQGPARARNLGVEQTFADIVVFVDSDVQVHPDAFSRIRQAFEDEDDLAAVFGSYDDEPESYGLVSDFRNLLHHHVHQQAAGPATTFWAGLGAVRRDAFLAVGGFDENRFSQASIEDIELGMRLSSDGRRIRLDPEIQGKHLKHWTLTSMVRTDFVRRGVPWVRLLLASDSGSTALNLGWRHRMSAVASGTLIFGLATRRPRTAIATAVVLGLLNRRFYVLLAKKRGWRRAAVGIPLHVLHHLVGIAAVPAGIALHVRDQRTTPA